MYYISILISMAVMLSGAILGILYSGIYFAIRRARLRRMNTFRYME